MQNQPESTLVELILYNNWATQKLLEILENLPAETLALSAPGIYGSIHRTLGHMLASEAEYVRRMTLSETKPPFQWEEGPSVAEIAAYAQTVGEAMLAAVRGISPEEMVHEEGDDFTVDYQARVLFMQAIEHGIEHRTNITTILTSQGVELPELDIWGYATSHPERFRWQEGSK